MFWERTLIRAHATLPISGDSCVRIIDWQPDRHRRKRCPVDSIMPKLKCDGIRGCALLSATSSWAIASKLCRHKSAAGPPLASERSDEAFACWYPRGVCLLWNLFSLLVGHCVHWRERIRIAMALVNWWYRCVMMRSLESLLVSVLIYYRPLFLQVCDTVLTVWIWARTVCANEVSVACWVKNTHSQSCVYYPAGSVIAFYIRCKCVSDLTAPH